MSKIFDFISKGLALSVLFSLAIQFNANASHHEEASTKEHETVLEVGNVQDEQWADAPQVPILDNKRYSQYAVDMQLEQGKDGIAPSDKTLFYLLITLIVVLLLAVLGTASKLLSGLSEISGNSNDGPNYNKINGSLLLLFVFVFFGGIAYEIMIHKDYLLPESASSHGVEIDNIMWITAIITGIVFILTQFLLFFFAFKYQQKEGQEAVYYPKNDKLEILWTSVPAVVLTILVLFGFKIWVNTTITTADQNEYEVELYAYQFGWKFRYPGADGKLGKTDYRFINLDPSKGEINPLGLDQNDPASMDDIVKDELILPKGKLVKLRMRSRDVLHSALLPHFRAQMYCVPGTPTQFNISPLYTTEEYRNKINKPDFNFELACNQICGASHYAMKREIIVVDEGAYLAWMNEQTPMFANKTADSNNQITLK